LWFLVFSSGVHATFAGVLLAMTIPARSKMKGEQFLRIGRQSLDMFEQGMAEGDERVTANAKLIGAVFSIRRVSRNVATPLQRIEHALHPWVVFSIVPIFALANAGVSLSGNSGELMLSFVTLGIVLGLVLGKPIGIVFFCWLSVTAGIATLPRGVTWCHIIGVACLAGIGFTMSLLISQLSFSGTAFMEPAKLGILIASLFSGVIGWLILWHAQNRRTSGHPSSNTH
jgi:NhaA family Na+:H+ antiporter